MPVSDSRIMRKKLSLRSHQHDKRPNSLLRRQAGSTAAAIATYVVPCNLEFYTEQHIRPTSSAFIALCRSVKFKLKYWIFNKNLFILFENDSKCRIWIFEAWHFSPLFQFTVQFFMKTWQNGLIFGHF